MKYTDQWFKFPIKVYDYISIKEAHMMEEATGVKEDGEWAPGYYRVLPGDIIGWTDTFTRPRSAKDGCNATLIILKDDEVQCIWDSQKFEDRLNTFIKEQEKEFDRQQENELEEIQRLAEEEDTDNNSITNK